MTCLHNDVHFVGFRQRRLFHPEGRLFCFIGPEFREYTIEKGSELWREF